MNNDNRPQRRPPAIRKLHARIGILTHELLSAADYETALNISVELMDLIHELLDKLREPEDSRVQ